MRIQIYSPSAANIVDAEYDNELNCIIVTWHNMLAVNDLEPCSRAQIRIIREKNAKSIIMNTSFAKNIIRQDDLDWLEAFYFPRLVHAKLNDIIIIPPVSALTKDSLDNYEGIAEKFRLTVHKCPDLETAYDVARSINFKNV